MTTLEKISGAVTTRKYLSLGENSAATFYYNWIIFCCHSILFLIELGVLVELLYFWFVTFIFIFLTKKEVYMNPFVRIGNQYFSHFFFLKKLTWHFVINT